MECLYDEAMMQLALAEARLAKDAGEIPVGAVIACDGNVISSAHNLCETNHSAIAHAEMLAIDAACKKLGRWRLSDCTLYVTLEPCPMCTGAAINARIGRIVFATKDARAGACGSLINLPVYPLEAHPMCECGLLQKDAAELLSSFFADRRKKRTVDQS